MKNENSTPARRGFTFYRSFLDGINALPESYHAPLYEAIVRYALDFQEPDFSGYENAFVYNAVWANIRPVLEKDIKHFVAGCGGGAPEGNSNAQKQPKTTKEQPKNNQTPSMMKDERCKMKDERCKMEDERCKMKDGELFVADAPTPTKKPISFVAPSLEDVEAYAREIGAPEKEAGSFHDYFTSVGWVMSGGRKIKDWKSAFRHWMNNAEKYKNSRPSTSPTKSRTEIPHAEPGEFKTTL